MLQNIFILTCVIDSSIHNEIKQNNATMARTFHKNEKSHPKHVSLMTP